MSINKYQAYPEYKDSKVKWFGKIPAHWNVAGFNKYLDSIVDYRGKTPNKTESGVFLVTARNIKNGKLDYTLSQEFIAKSDYENVMSRGKPSIGDVLFTTEAPLGESANVDNPKIALAQRIIKFNGKKEYLDNYYFKYLILSEEFQQSLTLHASGSTAKGIKAERFVYLRKLLPPIDEQRNISAFLDHETAKIDRLIEKQQQLIELLKEKRQAVISHAVTKGLNPNTPMKDSGVEWLGDVPAHWKKFQLKWLFKQAKRQGHEGKEVLSVYRDFGVIKKSSRDDNFNKTPENLSVYQLVEPGDLVINKMKAWQGSLGVSDFVGITSPDYVVYESCHEENDQFIHFSLRAKHMPNVYRAISNGIRPSQWRLEPEKFEDLFVFFPPKMEQQKIVRYLNKQVKHIDLLNDRCLMMIEFLYERRTALISAAVTGKIDVRNWQE